MRIILTTTGKTLDSLLDLRFGRTDIFMIVDTSTMKYEALENTGAAASGGAGITGAQIVVDKEADAVITGNVGPNAMNVLRAAGVEIYRGSAVSVKENIAQYNKGMLEKISATVPANSGMGKEGAR